MTSMPAEIGLIALREVRRSIRSGKGIAGTVLFLLGGALAVLAYVAAHDWFQSIGISQLTAAASFEMRHRALLLMYGNRAIADSLMSAPEALLWFHGMNLVFVPLLAILIGFDQVAGDLQHKTIRYTTLRARRASIVLGKAFGTWATVSAISLLLCVFVWLMIIGNEIAPIGTTLSWGLHLWLASSFYAGVYVGLTVLISSLFTTPVLALLVTLVVAFGGTIMRWISDFAEDTAPIHGIRYLTPGEYDKYLLSPEALPLLGGILATLVFIAIGIGGASLVLSRRDV